MAEDTAQSLMRKIRSFSSELPDEERALFAALIAPGIARALEPEPEVEGFGLTGWLPSRLPDALERAVRDENLRVEGL
jgi:hypothetical protein